MRGNKKMKYFNEVFQKSSTGRGWSEGENKNPRRSGALPKPGRYQGLS
jgi:hypothetical protein